MNWNKPACRFIQVYHNESTKTQLNLSFRLACSEGQIDDTFNQVYERDRFEFFSKAETRCNIGSAGRNIRACQWKDGPSLAHSRGDADDHNNYITYNKLSCDTVPLQTGWIAREEAFMARWLQITSGECTYRTIDGKPIATLLDFITLYLLTDVYEVYTVVSELNKILLEKIRASDHLDHTLRCYYNAYILVGHLDWMVLY